MYKKLIVKIFILTIPVVLLIVAVNYRIDGAFVFDKRSDEIAGIIVSGKNAAVKYIPAYWGDLQIEILRARIAQGSRRPHDILVFGTSRSSEISAKLFPENSFFNCVIPGGDILDYLGLYGLYKSNNLLPKYLIISIDPWTFHERKSISVGGRNYSVADSTLHLKVNPDLSEGLINASKTLGINSLSGGVAIKKVGYPSLCRELFSPTYFQLNARAIFSKIVFPTVNDFEPSYFVVRSDGGYSLTHQSKVDSIKNQKKSEDFIAVNKDNFFLSSDSTSIYYNHFKRLVTCLKKDKVMPIIYFSPVDPVVFDGLSNSHWAPIELAINNFCYSENIKVIGSFNPHLYGYHTLSNNFMDAYHPVRSVVDNIFHQHKVNLAEIGLTIANPENN